MSKNANPPATKADIDKVMEAIANLYDANETWKGEILTATERWKNELLTASEGWKDELTHHFDIAFENHSIDVIGAYGDRYESLRDVQRQHGQRLNRIEANLSIAG